VSHDDVTFTPREGGSEEFTVRLQPWEWYDGHCRGSYNALFGRVAAAQLQLPLATSCSYRPTPPQDCARHRVFLSYHGPSRGRVGEHADVLTKRAYVRRLFEFAWAVAEQRCAVDYEMTARRKKARKKQIDLLFLLTHPSCNARLVMVGRCEALDPAGPFRKDNPGTPEEWFDHDALLVQLELEPVTLAEFVRGLVTALIDAAILSKPGRRDAAEPCSSLLDSGVCDEQSCQKQHALPFWEDEKVLLASEGGGACDRTRGVQGMQGTRRALGLEIDASLSRVPRILTPGVLA